MNKYKSKKGISFLTVIGSYGGFHKTITDHSLHLCVGWIAFTIFFYDVENALAKTLLKDNKEQLNIGVVGCSFLLELHTKYSEKRKQLDKNLEIYIKAKDEINHDLTFTMWNSNNLFLWDIEDTLARMGKPIK